MDGMQIRKIEFAQRYQIREFLSSLGNSSKTFRYYHKRPLSIIKNHIVTLLAFDNNNLPIGYGHLDPDGVKVWLGICISDKWQRRGIGTQMMNHLIREAKAHRLAEIYLSVDADNVAAIDLYKQFNFHQATTLDGKKFFKCNLALME